MNAICLVVVFGGIAEAVAPPHVDCRIVDTDNTRGGDGPTRLPRGIGFEALVAQFGESLVEGVDYRWVWSVKA